MAASLSGFPAPLARADDDDPEEIARSVYERNGLAPDGEEGPGELLRRLFGPASIELGSKVRPGHVLVELSSSLGGVPVCVRMSDRQTASQDTLACSKACAIHEAWSRGEQWSTELLSSVTAAIALPAIAARKAFLDGWTVDDLAGHFALEPGWVLARMKSLGCEMSAPDVA